MDRIASQARLDGQLLGGASTLEWPQISDGVQDGCLGYFHIQDLLNKIQKTNLVSGESN